MTFIPFFKMVINYIKWSLFSNFGLWKIWNIILKSIYKKKLKNYYINVDKSFKIKTLLKIIIIRIIVYNYVQDKACGWTSIEYSPIHTCVEDDIEWWPNPLWLVKSSLFACSSPEDMLSTTPQFSYGGRISLLIHNGQVYPHHGFSGQLT